MKAYIYNDDKGDDISIIDIPEEMHVKMQNPRRTNSEESIAVTKQMRERGLDLLNVSVNFVIPDVKIPWGTPAFLRPHRPAREPRSRHSRGIELGHG